MRRTAARPLGRKEALGIAGRAGPRSRCRVDRRRRGYQPGLTGTRPVLAANAFWQTRAGTSLARTLRVPKGVRTEEATRQGADMTIAARASINPDRDWPARFGRRTATPGPTGVSTFEASGEGHQPGSLFNTARCHGPTGKTARWRASSATPHGSTAAHDQASRRHVSHGLFDRILITTGTATAASPPPSPHPDFSSSDGPNPLGRPQPADLPWSPTAPPKVANATKTVVGQSLHHLPSATINRGSLTASQAQISLDTFALRDCGRAATAGESTR